MQQREEQSSGTRTSKKSHDAYTILQPSNSMSMHEIYAFLLKHPDRFELRFKPSHEANNQDNKLPWTTIKLLMTDQFADDSGIGDYIVGSADQT